ncbi:hypothetical protein MHYP_G00139830 [Metynnis hypsauchen]
MRNRNIIRALRDVQLFGVALILASVVTFDNALNPSSAHFLEVTVNEPAWVAVIPCSFSPESEGECSMDGERKSKRIDERKRKAIDENSAGAAPTLQVALRRANKQNAALKVKLKSLEEKVTLLEDDKQFLRQSLSDALVIRKAVSGQSAQTNISGSDSSEDEDSSCEEEDSPGSESSSCPGKKEKRKENKDCRRKQITMMQ